MIGGRRIHGGAARRNDCWTGLLYIQTRSLLMSLVSDAAEQDAELINRAQTVKYCVIMAPAAPAVVLYLVMRRFFAKGVMVGSIK